MQYAIISAFKTHERYSIIADGTGPARFLVSGFSRKEHKDRKGWGRVLAHATFAKSAKFLEAAFAAVH